MLRTWRYRCGRALRIAKILRKREGPDPALKLNPSSWYSLGSYIRRQRSQTSAKGKAFSMSSLLVAYSTRNPTSVVEEGGRISRKAFHLAGWRLDLV
jgi:hypothetical protein